MIARSPQPVGTPDWQAALRAAYRDPRALLAYLGLAPADLDLDLESPFPFRVTREFAARMRPGDPTDPLLRQVLPLEKIGLLQRDRAGGGLPQLLLTAGGARRLREARETARALLAEDAAHAATIQSRPA